MDLIKIPIDIIGEIINFLPISNLLILRKVCRTFNKEVLKILKITVEITKGYIERFTLRNNVRDGFYNYMYYDGIKETPYIICKYENGKRQGEYKEFFKNGNLRILCYYINGKIDGIYKRFAEDAKQINTGICKDGLSTPNFHSYCIVSTS